MFTPPITTKKRPKTLEILQGSFWDAIRVPSEDRQNCVVEVAHSATVAELTDYYPYGGTRLDEQSGGLNEQRKFTGQDYDAGTGLYYMNARYQNPNTGKFISEDPSFLAMGDPNQIKQLTNQQLQQFLANPQALNAYSYALDNPLINTDPTGNLSIGEVWNSYIQGVRNTENSIGSNLSQGFSSAVNFSVSFQNSEKQFASNNPNLTNLLINLGTAFSGEPNPDAIESEIGANTQIGGEETGTQSGNMACRGGSCTAENFLKGSNEYKSGLNPTLETPLTGISVNAGDDLNTLLQSGKLPQWSQFGQSSLSTIESLGGSVAPATTDTNPYHAEVNGLNANQLEELFNPTQENPYH